MLISSNLHKKSSEVSIKTRSPRASFSFKGQATQHTTVQWSITSSIVFLKFLSILKDANSDIINYQDREGRTAVHLAVAQQNEPAVKALLLHDKCDVSLQDNVKRSPLHWAAVLGLIYFCIDPNFSPLGDQKRRLKFRLSLHE